MVAWGLGWGDGQEGSGRGYKKGNVRDLCGHGTVLYLDCSGGYKTYTWGKMVQN